MAIDCELVQAAKAWPFQEARNVIDRLGGADASHTPEKGYVLFETGYGPSGLPHIGTFGEVGARPWCAMPLPRCRISPRV